MEAREATSRWKIASRLNSFLRGGVSVAEAIRRMAAVPGLTALELNYPEHFLGVGDGELENLLVETALPLTGVNLRLRGDQYARGAFTSPDRQTRAAALATARAAVDTAATHGAQHVILWMGDDGWDYPLQTDYDRLWHDEIEGFMRVAAHDPTIRVSVEYKPFDPRRWSLVRSMSDALLAARDVDLPNFGVTVDVCHGYMAGEHPPAAAAAALREGRLFGLHLNDGYGRADDGLRVASVHERDTLELLFVLRHGGYAGTIYFDTFPDREDPGQELAENIAVLARLMNVVDTIDAEALTRARDRHDALAVSRLLALTGPQ